MSESRPESALAETTAPQSPGAAAEPRELPPQIGRYRVDRLLGRGAFGCIYLAHDDELNRPVAVKVPHRARIVRPEDVQAYVTEARLVANLDHPHIVPVFDAGRTDDGLCFVVSKLIDGTDLRQRLADARPALGESVALVAAVARALHYAHGKGLVHRDVKPANILIDRTGKAFVTDFGLALRDEDFGREAGLAGTPAYMSPEQARGEGHRVDGRSDVFSLGVVLYELLTGRRPFWGSTYSEILERVAAAEVRPPRQLNDAIPRELERICLKALARRASERYTTARDFAEDLEHFLEATRQAGGDLAAEAPTVAALSAAAPAPSSERQPIRVVPKGLRAFDADDADFFLALLPGPRDRDGLPESVRFWKKRIEETDADNTFAVGLLYGPSGCGKSSLVKAGLLPRLSERVLAVYVEATAEETEARLLKGLRKHCPALANPSEAGLAASLATIRWGTGAPDGRKVLIVLDQFEQWLHARRTEEEPELVRALRQCDGEHLQCVVMVRDDFWMAATRFMADLEIPLIQGENSAAVDLFDLRHARRVLEGFGRALGALPEWGAPLSAEQTAFLEQAVAGLAVGDKVIPVHLALFAEMVKSKAWTAATLKAVGGIEGVGIAFLEDTFAARGADPRHRLHEKAARAVLGALLPERGADIRGRMRARQELLEASGYAGRPRDFEELLRLLDGELRLITPTDPEAAGDAASATPQAADGYFQLTHDYLVPSVREWLARRQNETWRGRAEIRLAERTNLWRANRERKQLPTAWETVLIRLLTRKKDWTAPQRDMMRIATRNHLLLLACLLLVGLLGLAGMMSLEHSAKERDAERSAALKVQSLLGAEISRVPDAVQAISDRERPYADPLLRQALAESDHDKRLRASLGLLPVDRGQVDFLVGELLHSEPHAVGVIRDALRSKKESFTDRLWGILVERNSDADERFRAACVLADYSPADPRWADVRSFVTAALVTANDLQIHGWSELLRPVGPTLLPELADFLANEGSPYQRERIATLYANLAGNQSIFFDRLAERLADAGNPNAAREARIALNQRRANIGAGLMAMGHGEAVWPYLKHTPDPAVRSYLIERMLPSGADPKVLAGRLATETDPSIRRAILLALGEVGPDALPAAQRERVLKLYETDPDAGVHAAVGWLMDRWKLEQTRREKDAVFQADGLVVPGGRQWYVNAEGQTLVILPGPAKVFIDSDNKQGKTVGAGVSLAAREVTLGEFLKFVRQRHKKFQYDEKAAPTLDCPVNWVEWCEAAEYCNWLSEQDHIPPDQWCYKPNAKGKFDDGMTVVPHHEQLLGYRLPSEAEWVFGCRAGATTAWACGEVDDELIGRYAWELRNAYGPEGSQSFPTGTRRPNDFGLFDMEGNVSEYCQDTELAADAGSAIVKDEIRRATRGGSYFQRPADVGFQLRMSVSPHHQGNSVGFRVARTMR